MRTNSLLLCLVFLHLAHNAFAQSDSTYTIPYVAGWNLCEYSVTTDIPLEINDAFPASVIVYEYKNGKYNAVSEVVAGEAYWVLFAEAGEFPITGIPNRRVFTQLDPGWNLVGAPGNIVTSVIDRPEENVISIFGYNDGMYDSVDRNLMPGSGYWMLAMEPGSLELEADTSDVILRPGTKIVDSESQQLLVSVDTTELIFASTSMLLESVEVGDVLVSGTAERAPFGFLRKVLDIEQRGGGDGIRYRASRVTRCHIKRTSFSKSNPHQGGFDRYFRRENQVVTAVSSNDYEFTTNKRVTVVDLDGNPATQGDQ